MCMCTPRSSWQYLGIRSRASCRSPFLKAFFAAFSSGEQLQCVHMYMYACVCVCVREREREKQKCIYVYLYCGCVYVVFLEGFFRGCSQQRAAAMRACVDV